MLAQARTDVAMKKRFTALSFESVKFIDLFNDWWTNHGSRTRSKFQYRTPRVLARFEKKKAREITPDAVRDFLADLRDGRSCSIEHQPVPDHPLQCLQLCHSVREIRQKPRERRPSGEGTAGPGSISRARRNRCDDPRL